jgi:uncharacterized protein (DUF305 family)
MSLERSINFEWIKGLQLMHRFPLLLGIALLIFVSGCAALQPPASGTSNSTDNTGEMAMEHGDMNQETPFDAMFIDGMIEHHQGAIDMAEMALDQAEHEEIRSLADTIIAAQSSEIKQMQSWRTEWYPDLAATEGMAMDMGQMSISEDEAIPFDQRFLEAMISHHQGAIDMAEMALEQAEHEEIRTLAASILEVQSVEIKQMRGWLQEWYNVTD